MFLLSVFQPIDFIRQFTVRYISMLMELEILFDDQIHRGSHWIPDRQRFLLSSVQPFAVLVVAHDRQAALADIADGDRVPYDFQRTSEDDRNGVVVDGILAEQRPQRSAGRQRVSGSYHHDFGWSAARISKRVVRRQDFDGERHHRDDSHGARLQSINGLPRWVDGIACLGINSLDRLFVHS